MTVAGLLLLAAVALGGAVYFFLFSDYPGGMRPTYAATDGDSRLTRYATTGLSTIIAIYQYRAQHNQFPADVSQLVLLVPQRIVNVASHQVGSWTYQPDSKSDTFQLRLRLGWDPSLVYHGNQGSGTWAFEPGDGSPEKPIILNP